MYIVKNGKVVKINAPALNGIFDVVATNAVNQNIVGDKVTAKSTIVNVSCNLWFYDFYNCGLDGYTRVSTAVNQVLGTATGQTRGTITGETEVLLATKLGSFTAGSKVWIKTADINVVSGVVAEGVGFPIAYGSKGAPVTQLQNFLNAKGAQLPVTGYWGDMTQAEMVKRGLPVKINSQAELNAIISGAGGTLPTTQGGGTLPTTQGGGTLPTTQGGIFDVTPAPAQSGMLGMDLPTLAVGALVLYKLFGKKGKKKPKRR